MTPEAAADAVRAYRDHLSPQLTRSAHVAEIGIAVGAVLAGLTHGSTHQDQRLVKLAAHALSSAWQLGDDDVPDGAWVPRADDLDPGLYLLHLVGQVGTAAAFLPYEGEARANADTACVELAQVAMYLLTGGEPAGEACEERAHGD